MQTVAIPSYRWHTVFCLLAITGCGRYADFSLPAPLSGEPPLSFVLEQAPRPVLTRGATGEWDAADVLNPSVVERAGLLYNFYSGFDGKTWHTGLATSRDGVDWEKRGRVLSPDASTWEGTYIAANGAALAEGGEFLYWYQAGPREQPSIGLARSPDGVRWRKHPAPVLEPGPRGSWDERGVGDPFVLRIGRQLYMYFLGQDRARRQRLGVARSSDGIRWEKLRTNPVLEPGEYGNFDENGLGEPAVWVQSGSYWMLYTGRRRDEQRRLGLARSGDGVTWHRLAWVFAGAQAWNSKVVCDPAVLPGSDRVWFGGGDVPAPDENLHGQIGTGRLRATLSK